MSGRRSGEAQAARARRAGPMKHRNEPRGGARDEYGYSLDGYECTKCCYPIPVRDLVEWMGLTWHRRCMPKNARPAKR